MDQLSCISDPYRETAGFGAKIVFLENSVPECVAPPLADTDDLDSLTIPDPMKAERMRDRIAAVSLYKQKDLDQHSILGWVEGPGALSADLRGLQDFYMDMIEDPEWCGELLDISTEASRQFALAQVEAGADTIGIGDAMCSQISTDLYEALILPRQKRLVEAIHQAGANVRLHICGQTKHLLKGINSLKIDILDCDWMVPMDEARRELGPNVVLAGNLDPVQAVRFSDPEKIRADVLKCREQAGQPFMACAGCEIPSGTPNENLHALCEPLH